MHKTSPHRNQRLADQIQRDLAELIPRELRSSSLGLITLQSIELSPDLAHAKVFFTVLGAEPEHALKALQEKAGYLHSLLFKRLHIHTVPTLHFLYDRTPERAADMNALIARAVASRAKESDTP